MMTTMAALMRYASLFTISFGAGAESRRSLGLAVVGGFCFHRF